MKNQKVTFKIVLIIFLTVFFLGCRDTKDKDEKKQQQIEKSDSGGMGNG